MRSLLRRLGTGLSALGWLIVRLLFRPNYCLSDFLIAYFAYRYLPRTMEWWIQVPIVVTLLILISSPGQRTFRRMHFNRLAEKFANRVAPPK